MERKRGGTTEGVLVWTPTPVCFSPSSPEGSDISWDEEADKNFLSQMDENGIIGLADTQGQVKVDHREEEFAEDLLWDVKTPEPEYGPPQSTLEEINCHLSELLDSGPLSPPTENNSYTSYMLEEEQIADDYQSVLSESWTDEENNARSPIIHRQELNSFPERDGTLDMTDEDSEEKDTCDVTENILPLTEKIVPYTDKIKGFDGRNADSEVTEHSEQVDSEELKKSTRCFPASSHLSSPHTPLPPLKKIETFSAGGSFNIGVSSFSNDQRLDLKDFQTVHSEELEPKHKITPEISAKSPVMKIRLEKAKHGGTSEDKLERTMRSPHYNHNPPTPSPEKTNPESQDRAQRVAKTGEFSPPHCSSTKNNQRSFKTSQADPNDVRKGQLNHPLPDFSKVGPKVRFPKGGYKPPKNRAVAHGKASQPVQPVGLKSPAEIVREVLLSSTDETPRSPSSSGTHKPLSSKVPEEFRCPQQASTLVEQLQEDYNRLLTKYAEAENTIDRLRLKAKVDLYSDPPKASTAFLSGVIQEGSKVMTLSFPQAQRAQFGEGHANLEKQRDNLDSRKNPTRPSSENSVSSRRSVSITADHLTETLTNQTCRFQLQVDSFEKLLKNGKLKPSEQLEGVSTLAEGQESLERAYLDTRAQFQMLQQHQCKPLTFDSDRDLESQIFKSGMRLEELREQVLLNQPTLEPPTTSPLYWDMLSMSMLDTEPLPETPLSAAHPQACVYAEVSSVSGESNGEEILPSLLHPLNGKHERVEKDFGNLMDCFQSFKELPGLLDRNVNLMGRDMLDLKDPIPPMNAISINKQQQQWFTTETEKRKPLADLGTPSGPSVRSQVCDTTETRPKAPCHSSLLPGQPGSKTKTAGNRKVLSSSLTNLAEGKETGNMVVKAKAKNVLAPHLDGVVSPETDSGFMGSETSQLTPAVHSPLQQRAAVSSNRSSGPQIHNTIRPESAHSSRHPSVVSSPLSQCALDPPAEHIGSRGGTVGRKRRQERCSASSLGTSTLHWAETPVRPRISSLTSQSELGSCMEEEAQDRPYPCPSNTQPCFNRSPSLHVPYHRGDLKSQSTVQLTHHQEALQSLQQEVNMLKERLEGTLGLSKSSSPLKVPSHLSEDIRDHATQQTATPQWLDIRSSERRAVQRERRRGELGGKVRVGAPQSTLRKRSASLPRYKSESNTTSDSEQSCVTVLSEPKPSTLNDLPALPLTSRGTIHFRSGFGSHQTSTRVQVESENSGAEIPELTCPRCMSERTGAPSRPARSRSSPRPAKSHCSNCPLCGAFQSGRSRAPQPENLNPVYAHKWAQPMRSLQKDSVGVNMPVAPPLNVLGSVPVVSYVPVYPSTLYISSPAHTHSQPFNISTPSRDERSEVRGHRRRSLSVDHQQSSLDSSLTRAIRVAKNMRRVSRHMAHSMASGLENMSLLETTF